MSHASSRSSDDSPVVRLTWPGKPILALDALPAREPAALYTFERWNVDSASAMSAATTSLVGWRNLLSAGDAEDVIAALMSPPWDQRIVAAGGVKLIYLDPPFATGDVFAARVPIGPRDVDGVQPVMSVPAYRDVWTGGLSGYLTVMARWLVRLHALLADDGWLCLHADHRATPHLRLILDELFGPASLINEIIWSYGLGNNTRRGGFPRKHDTLLLYAKTPAARFFPVRGEVTPAMRNKYRHVRPDGTLFMRSYGKEYDLKGGKPLGSVWEIPSVAPTSGERTGYPTQKPVALLERLLLATTQPGELVLDPCSGSGTTPIVAESLERRWIGVDASPVAHAASRSRLLRGGAAFDVARVRAFGHGADELFAGGYVPEAYATFTSEGEAYRLSVSLSPAAVVGGLDAIEGWAVHLGGFCGQDQPVFMPVWFAFRSGPDRALPIIAPTLPTSGDVSALPALVRCYDTVGGWRDVTATVSS